MLIHKTKEGKTVNDHTPARIYRIPKIRHTSFEGNLLVEISLTTTTPLINCQFLEGRASSTHVPGSNKRYRFRRCLVQFPFNPALLEMVPILHTLLTSKRHSRRGAVNLTRYS